MLQKLGIAGLVAGAAMGAVMAAAPAYAQDGSQANNNLQLVPIQACNLNAVIAVPIFSPQHTGHCTNGPIDVNVEKHKHHGHHKHHGYY
ncbi:hypothetical protein CDO52_25400 [Nocardiopsis gilva YIM 90087]|uniref:DUF320 domain-containing protein n=1 Tax=Nocardiopsis gilva YIM 90087 TaxID=1235441 RepID=A0A223SC74_9ACTN|nr:hypothetical protein [Nocardiopsis gilva]ASU85695.1 hypothetical protein CDO52_25400 [Nocardiopsis gilva YIM 90087]